jgi:exonuclease III
MCEAQKPTEIDDTASSSRSHLRRNVDKPLRFREDGQPPSEPKRKVSATQSETQPHEAKRHTKAKKSQATQDIDNSTDCFKIMSVNVHGALVNRQDALSVFIADHSPDFLFITETGLKRYHLRKMMKIRNYTHTHVVTKEASRGISLYIEDKWLPFIMPVNLTETHNEELSAIHFSVHHIATPIHVIGLYGNPSEGRAAYWEKMHVWIERVTNASDRVILIGDMNEAPDPIVDREQLGGLGRAPCAPFSRLLKEGAYADVWRMLHGEKKQFTFMAARKKAAEAPRSRIDLVLASKNMLDSVPHCEILDMPPLCTDHFPIEAIVNLPEHIRNMPNKEQPLPEIPIHTFNVELLRDPAVASQYQEAFDEKVMDRIRGAATPLEMYSRLVKEIDAIAIKKVGVHARIMNREWRPPRKSTLIEIMHGRCLTVMASRVHLLSEMKAHNAALRVTHAIEKLVRHEVPGFAVTKPPATADIDAAIKWFDEVERILDAIRTKITSADADKRAERIIQAVERADEAERSNPKMWFSALQSLKSITQSKKKQVNVVNEVDPTQRKHPEYEGAAPEQLLEAVRKYYAYALQTRMHPEDAEKPWLTEEFVKAREAAQAAYRGELVAPITTEILESTLKRIPKGKASGPDDLPIELIQYLPRHILALLAGLFTQFIDRCETPDEWRHCRIFTIHKSGDIARCSNYRPISLQSVVYKTFSSVLTKRLSDLVEHHSLLSNTQGGFRRGRSCLEKVNLLTLVARSAKERGQEMHILFADVKKAYDSVPIDKLGEALHYHGIDKHFIDLIMNIYRNNTADVITVHGHTKSLPVGRGVKQGDPLSCLLFTLFLEPAVDWITSTLKSKGGEALAFADDLALACISRDQLQTATDMLQRYLHHNGLELGV